MTRAKTAKHQNSRASRASHFRAPFKSGLVVVISVAVGMLFTNAASHHVLGASTADTVITVTPGASTAVVPSRFQGLSFETANTCNMVGKWDQDIYTEPNGAKVNVFEQLLENLHAQVIRIGGVTADKNVLWSTTGQSECIASKTVLTPQLIDSIFNLGQRVNGKIIWTLDLANYAPATYSQEAKYVMADGAKVAGTNGTYLWGLAMGNEPDLFGSPTGVKPGYTLAQYISDWNNYEKIIRANSGHPTFTFAGDDNASNMTWFTTFLSDEKGGLSRVNKHFYPTSANGTGSQAPTIANLLSPSLMSTTANDFDTWRKLSGSIPLAIDETNSTTGGVSGVSNSFGASLWGLDYELTALEHGVAEINYHTGSSPSIYSPITNYNNNTWVAQPLYYAMLAFAQAAPNGHVVQTTVSSNVASPPYIVAHSILDTGGQLHVVVINKDLTAASTVQVASGESGVSATYMMLTAPSVSATSGVTLGGASVQADGTWPARSSAAAVTNGAVTLSLPATSAAIITFSSPTTASQAASTAALGLGPKAQSNSTTRTNSVQVAESAVAFVARLAAATITTPWYSVSVAEVAASLILVSAVAYISFGSVLAKVFVTILAPRQSRGSRPQTATAKLMRPTQKRRGTSRSG